MLSDRLKRLEIRPDARFRPMNLTSTLRISANTAAIPTSDGQVEFVSTPIPEAQKGRKKKQHKVKSRFAPTPTSLPTVYLRHPPKGCSAAVDGIDERPWASSTEVVFSGLVIGPGPCPEVVTQLSGVLSLEELESNTSEQDAMVAETTCLDLMNNTFFLLDADVSSNGSLESLSMSWPARLTAGLLCEEQIVPLTIDEMRTTVTANTTLILRSSTIPNVVGLYRLRNMGPRSRPPSVFRQPCGFCVAQTIFAIADLESRLRVGLAKPVGGVIDELFVLDGRVEVHWTEREGG